MFLRTVKTIHIFGGIFCSQICSKKWSQMFIKWYIHRVCRWNMPDSGRMFLKLKYTDTTQKTYIRNWMVTEITAREKYDLLAVPRTVPVSRGFLPVHWACPSLSLHADQDHSRCDFIYVIYTLWRSDWGTALQTGRSRDWFPMVSLEFFIHIILPSALWPWGRLNL
jgi:hypothetical protein